MIDLFGLKQKSPASAPESAQSALPGNPAPSAASAPRSPRGSHRLWAFLLILDAAFVIVFGGLVATKVYQSWDVTPAPLPPPTPRRRALKPAVAPAAAAPASAPPPAAPAPLAAPPAPPPAPAVNARPPKPSLLEAAGAEGKIKAVAAEFKLHAPHAESVQLIGAFIAHGGRKDMTLRRNGTWSEKLYLKPGEYRYYFMIDGKKTLDPKNAQTDRGASLLVIP